MKFPVAVVLAFLASAYAQTSSTANPFSIPTSGFAPRAGSSIQITWNPTTSGTVSLYLRSGASNNLITGVPIAQGIANSGSYTWNVPSDVTRGSDYALEIRSADGLSNYSPQFVIESTNTVASITNSGSSSASARTSGATVSSGSVTVTSSSAATSGSSSAATSGASSSGASSSGTRTTTSGTASTTNSAGFQSATSATSSRTNAAPQATAAAGLMAAVAMAAFAL